MEQPKIDARETFEDMEKKYGITKETNDFREKQLGCHPSESYYCNKEEVFDLNQMRKKFDRIARKY